MATVAAAIAQASAQRVARAAVIAANITRGASPSPTKAAKAPKSSKKSRSKAKAADSPSKASPKPARKSPKPRSSARKSTNRRRAVRPASPESDAEDSEEDMAVYHEAMTRPGTSPRGRKPRTRSPSRGSSRSRASEDSAPRRRTSSAVRRRKSASRPTRARVLPVREPTPEPDTEESSDDERSFVKTRGMDSDIEQTYSDEEEAAADEEEEEEASPAPVRSSSASKRRYRLSMRRAEPALARSPRVQAQAGGASPFSVASDDAAEEEDEADVDEPLTAGDRFWFALLAALSAALLSFVACSVTEGDGALAAWVEYRGSLTSAPVAIVVAFLASLLVADAATMKPLVRRAAACARFIG